MASPTTFSGDVVVPGTLYVGSFVPSAGSVRNAGVAADAAIQATKLQHQYVQHYFKTGTAATETVPIHVAYGATGTIVAIKAGSIAIAVGAATVTIDLKKNGTTCLSAVITLDSGNTARVVEAGTLTVTDYVTGDFFELVITATAGGGTIPTGLGVVVVFREDAA